MIKVELKNEFKCYGPVLVLDVMNATQQIKCVMKNEKEPKRPDGYCYIEGMRVAWIGKGCFVQKDIDELIESGHVKLIMKKKLGKS